MKKLRIFVTRESTHLCGVTVVDNFISAKLEKLGHITTTMTPARPFAKPKRNQLFSSICLYLPRKKYWFTFPLIVPRILILLRPVCQLNYWLMKRKIRKANPDIILNHGDNQIAAIATKAGNELGIPVVTIAHTAYWIYIEAEVKNRWLRRFILNCQNDNSQYVVDNSDHVIYLSEWFKREYLKLNPLAKTDHMTLKPNVVEYCELKFSREYYFRGQIAKMLPCFRENPIIGCIGRLEEVKNWHFMLEVMRTLIIIREGKPLPHMVFIGKGPLKAQLEDEAISMGLEPYVHFLGQQDSHWTNLFIKYASDLICAPSISETDGLVPKQARLYGKPAYVPKNTAQSETSPEEYILPLDPLIWANAINNLLYQMEDPQKKDSIENDLVRDAMIKNDHDVYIKSFLDIFESLCR